MRAPIISTSLFIYILSVVSAVPAAQEHFKPLASETAAAKFPSITAKPSRAILQERQNADQTTAPTTCNPTPTCKYMASGLACGVNFDNPHTTLCTCNDGCTYTDVGNTDSMCNWSTTPPGGPLTVDCTRVPQASISGPNKCPYEQWNPTVENWNDANVDGELSSFFMDEVTDAPTYIHNTYPTKLPRIGTGPGSNNGSIGYVGKLISAAKGDIAVDCTNIIGGNMAGCHPPPSVDEACGNVPRWAYLAWTGIWNQIYIHAQIYAILESVEGDVFGQLGLLTANFSLQESTPVAVQIFLSVLGALATVVGILIPLTTVGVAATSLIDAAVLAAAMRQGSRALDKGLVGGLPKSLSQPVVQPKPQDPNDPDAILPANDRPIVQPEDAPHGPKVPITSHPEGGSPKLGNPTFIGNVAWVTPGTLVNLGNTVWSTLKPKSDPLTLLNTVQSNAGAYIMNQKNITSANNAALTTSWTDTDVATSLLNVHAFGMFIDPKWSPDIYQNVLSADLISREINGLWRTSGANTYISYTFLDDDANSTKCYGPDQPPSGDDIPGDKNGPPATKYCADQGVYYLNKLDTSSAPLAANLHSPNGFDSLANFGIWPWFPASGSARAYRALNPDANQTPVYDTPEAEEAYNSYINDFASKHTGDLMSLIGQTPGSWSLPVCDQGGNTWTHDWSNNGGLQLSSDHNYELTLPCACGHLGSGTANFYKALNIPGDQITYIAKQCQSTLLNVGLGLDLKKENFGWNLIVGGKPETIVYDSSNTITAPDSLPTKLCYTDGSANKCVNNPPQNPDQITCQQHNNCV